MGGPSLSASSVRETLWRGSAVRGAFSVLGKAGALLTALIVVRLLPRAEAGRFFFALSVAYSVALLVRLGLPEAVARVVAREDALGKRRTADATARLCLRVSWFMAGAALVIAAVLAATDLVDGLLVAAAAIGGFLSVQYVSSAFLQARGRPLLAEVWQGSVPLAFAVAVLVMSLTTQLSASDGILMRTALEGGATLTLLVWVIRHTRPGSDRVPIRPLLALSLPLWMTSLSWLVLQHSDVVILGLARTAPEVATYVPILRAVDVALVPFFVIGSYLLPAASRTLAGGLVKDLQSLYASTSKFAFALAFPVLATIFLRPNQTLEMLFGISGASVTVAARTLVAGYLFHILLGFNGVVLEAVGKVRRLAIRSGAAVILGITINVVLVPRMGFLGAAIGTTVAISGLNIANSVMLFAETGLKPFSSDMLLTILTAGLASVLVWAVGGQEGLVATLLSFAALAVPTLAVAWITTPRHLRRELFGRARQ